MVRRKPRSASVDLARVLGDARLGDLRFLAEEPVGYDALHDATERLFSLLEQRHVDYLLVGGLAMLQYVEGRNTRDIDLVMALDDLKRLPGIAIAATDGDFARATFDGVDVDVLLTSNGLFAMVRQRCSTPRKFGSRTIPCATPEGLILLKLFALPSLYRQGDVARIAIYENDIRMLVQQYSVDARALLPDLKAHVLPSDVEELGRILADIEVTIARFEARPFGREAEPRANTPGA